MDIDNLWNSFPNNLSQKVNSVESKTLQGDIYQIFNMESEDHDRQGKKINLIEKAKKQIEKKALIKQINKTIKSKLRYYINKKIIEAKKEWIVECKPHLDDMPIASMEKDVILGNDVLFKIWENSMSVRFDTTPPISEQWHDIKKCIFKFAPEHMNIQIQIDLLTKFKQLLDEY